MLGDRTRHTGAPRRWTAVLLVAAASCGSAPDNDATSTQTDRAPESTMEGAAPDPPPDTAPSIESTPPAIESTAPAMASLPEAELTPITPANELPRLDRPSVPALQPRSAAVVGERPGAIRYDLSPDGRSKVTSGTDGVCIATIDDVDRVCTEDHLGFEPWRISWAPDSSAVVISPDVFGGDYAPIVLFSTTGELSVVRDVAVAGEFTPGDAIGAQFTTPEEIVYWSFGNARDTTEFHTIGRGGNDDRLAVEFTGFGPEFSHMIEGRFLADHNAVYTLANALTDEMVLGRFDLASGTWVPVPAMRTVDPRGRATGEQTAALTEDVVITVDRRLTGDRLRNRELAPFFEIVAVDGTAAQLIEDRPDHLAIAVSFSPSGDHVAMLSQYVGGDSDVLQSNDLMLLSITTTHSLLAGVPEWFDLTGVSPAGVSQDWDAPDSSIVWVDEDELRLEFIDRIVAVTVEPAA